jgi:hypothetical protein
MPANQSFAMVIQAAPAWMRYQQTNASRSVSMPARTRPMSRALRILRVLLEAGPHHFRETARRSRLRLEQRSRLFLEDRRREAGARLAGERSGAGDQLVEHDAEGEDVAARVGVMAFDLLGRHVRQRAQHRAFRRQRRGGGFHEAGAVVSGGALDLRESEIEDLHPALREQDVAGLQVAVDDAFFVRGIERVQDLLGQLERPSERHGSAQSLALNVLHDEVVRANVVE